VTHVVPSTQDEGEPWLGYIRVSTWKEEKISPELQETALRAWAARTGRHILEPFIIDLDATGRNFKRRIMQAIERVEAGEARGVAVWKFSRFGRSRDGIAINLKRLEDAGGQLASATEEGDARTATGRLQRGILFEFAAYESDVRGEQWRETHDHRRYKLHLPASGRRRFGYLWTPRRVPDPTAPDGIRLQEESYKAHPKQGPVMADRYRQFLNGDAFYALVADLNAAGWRTTLDNLWSEQTLIRYMDSGFCAGLLRIHNPKCQCGPGVRRHCKNFVFIPGAQDELISAQLWQEYQDRRALIRAIPPRARTPLYPLSGLLRCGQCRGTTPAKSAWRGPKGHKAHHLGYLYACGRRAVTSTHGCAGVSVNRHVVEKEVLDWLAREAAPGIDAAPATPLPEARTPLEARRADAARERERLQGEADKLSEALTNLRVQRAADPEEWAAGEYQAARDRIRERQAWVLAALERASAVESEPIREDYVPIAKGLLAEWDTLDVSDRNAMLRTLIRRVALVRTIGAAEIHIHPVWKPDPWADQPVSA
jgi:site-specific DNA recombinase